MTFSRRFHVQQLHLVFLDCFKCPNQAQSGGPSSPGLKLLCVLRRKFASLDLLRIRHFEKLYFRSDTYGTGVIPGKYQTGVTGQNVTRTKVSSAQFGIGDFFLEAVLSFLFAILFMSA